MPHTSHKKKQFRNKRQEIVDDDGWTRVSSSNAPALPQIPPPPASDSPINGEERSLNLGGGTTMTVHIDHPPKGLRLEDVVERYRKVERRWKASNSCKSMEQTLQTRILNSRNTISTCVLFGSGSFTGLRMGWIDRSEVSMYQLAAFLSATALIGNILLSTHEHIFTYDIPGSYIGRQPIIAAQEVVYNAMDADFLGELGVKNVEHPDGFAMLDKHSLAYCPGAEQDVLFTALRADPAIYLGHKLEFHRGALGCLQSGTIETGYTIYETEAERQEQNAAFLNLEDIEDMVENDTRKIKARQIVEKEDGQGLRTEDVDFTFDVCQVVDHEGVNIDKDWVRKYGKEEECDVNVIQYYLRDKEVAKVPDLDAQDYPLHNLYFHWRPQELKETHNF